MRTKRHCRNPPPPSDQSPPRRTGEDRIGALPDAVLIHILSYLPVIDAVKTGVLSKRWARLWTWTPNLIFNQLGEWDEKTNNFVPFIDSFLVLHSSPKIQKLALDLDYKGKRLHLDSSLDELLRFAASRAAEELNLRLSDLGHFRSWDFRGPVERYFLPTFIYDNNSMKRLDMSFIDVQPSDAVNWPLLQTLSITSAFINESTIQKILLGSPELKILELNNCEGFDRIYIDSRSLKRLVIHGIWFPTRGATDVLQISAPNILHLEISGHFYKRKVQLLDLSSLVDVIIDLQLWVQDRRCVLVEYSNILRGILRKIRHVEKLKVGASSIKILSMLKERFWSSLVSTRKNLILNVELTRRNISDIACFLQISPKLESLQINMASSHGTSRKVVVKSQKTSSSCLQLHFDPDSYATLESCLTPKNRLSKHLLEHLETVEIIGFNENHDRNGIVIALVRSLLKHAKVLEKIAIYAPEIEYNSDNDLIAKKLLTFRRASREALVLFY